MKTRKEKQDEAERLLKATQFQEVGLDETEIVQALYVQENDKLFGLEATMLDISKANFAVFGAIMLLTNTPYFANLTPSKATAGLVAAATIMVISFAASYLVTLYHKYLSVHRQKVSILQRGVWRRRPLKWIELKYDAEELPRQYQEAVSVGFIEYLTYGYILQWINLIPFGFAVILAAAFCIFGALPETIADS
ncbi:hypothetical protein [Ensifer aridi]|uniref:hypothetical protein n=1 Tax=Ensifer aridi TaxID=1708715 RepID=UPI000A105BCD|nr:hypothetical protein [Ensifer aridi]